MIKGRQGRRDCSGIVTGTCIWKIKPTRRTVKLSSEDSV